MRYVSIIFAAVLLAGCASMEMGWYKPDGTQEGFAQDKYQCMVNSQIRVSGAYVNAYGGAASSGAATNIPLFRACMEARGYVWTSRAQVDGNRHCRYDPVIGECVQPRIESH